LDNAKDRQRAYERHQALWDAVTKALHESHFCSTEEAERLSRELFRALCCKSRVDIQLSSLPPLLDHAWHQAILNTRLYRLFCDDVFCLFLEHSTTTASDSLVAKNRRIDVTVALYRALFEEDPPADLWEREDVGGIKRSAATAVEEAEEASDQHDIGVDKDGKFCVFIRTLTGRSVQMGGMSQETTVRELKTLVEKEEAVPVAQQRLIFSGKQLDDTKTLGHYGIRACATIHYVLKLRGC
jgi:hypothetical protein